MKRNRGLEVLCLALAATVLLAAVGAGEAAAVSPRWRTKNAYLVAGETRSFVANSTERTNIAGSGTEGPVVSSPKGECVITGTIVGSAVGAPGTKKEVAMACTSTIVTEPLKFCTVRSPEQPTGTITLREMKSTLVWLTKGGSSSADLFSAEGKGPLGELIIEGAGCTKKGTYKIENEVLAPILPVTEEVATLTQNFPEATATKWWTSAGVEQTITPLTVGGTAATFKGNFTFSLTPAAELGVFPG